MKPGRGSCRRVAADGTPEASEENWRLGGQNDRDQPTRIREVGCVSPYEAVFARLARLSSHCLRDKRRAGRYPSRTNRLRRAVWSMPRRTGGRKWRSSPCEPDGELARMQGPDHMDRTRIRWLATSRGRDLWRHDETGRRRYACIFECARPQADSTGSSLHTDRIFGSRRRRRTSRMRPGSCSLAVFGHRESRTRAGWR